MTKSYHVAVVGATGAVGTQMIELLEEAATFKIKQVSFLSSIRSAGKKLSFRGEEITIQEATPESFEGVDIALFSAGGSVSKALAKEAVKRGAIVIDNTSAYRMDPTVPLVVPEVNEKALFSHKGIIANPNCSTIQMVAALEPIREAYGLNRIIVSTYQAVSGSGVSAIKELQDGSRAVLDNKEFTPEIMPVKGDKKHYPIAFNALPQIDVFTENDYTYEEMKMINETKKIMEDDTIKVSATCVRIPVVSGHSESVYVEIDKEGVQAKDIQNVLKKAPGVILEDDPANQIYPQAIQAAGKKEVFVGRVRSDIDDSKGFHMWIVSDNLLKGAAWNSIQIAESLVKLAII
ncbi:aspartate-semialdehyde dehydrogenase [Listeria welshimeri]|uniref:Aspartate-semialdehyde dehydrogenase n=2 Tax=Listeria welshimeri TaxID=1643 RepID=A0ABX4IHN9_LISWE|nr:aspartate-semialdehyde dehydrogenase [Listeria welshimeri]MBC1243445.1 aspartate-semialdehyde dehydrogenase [Listeria welshimeri]MBC1248500.1 aspartate-semialdehyde dehydrogenase [Listeria welshimeri]MBC1340346.1 aspartate-semialdehyde dehydrogenase [Listeria welshimeri]MBC1345750.1 aspartate-semialdehyde dehydrogenase [Listeria welshimeri]MBC1354152.1 aspartate-semialdehyde dehydrogenase [Listeria welshimeri]